MTGRSIHTGEGSGVSTYDPTEYKEGRGISRRAFIGGSLGSAAAIAFGAKFAFGRSGEGSGGQTSAAAPEKKDPNDRSIDAEQAINNIENFTIPDNLYAEHPWANPAGLSELSPEKLRERSTAHLSGDTLTAENLEEIEHIMESIGSAGGEIAALIDARKKGYPVGERDSLGNLLGNYPQYVKSRFVSDMVDGLFPGSAGGEVNEGIKGYFAQYADAYERVLCDPRWENYLILLVDAEFANSEEGSPYINLTIGRPVAKGDWRDAPNVHKGEMVVGITKGTDGAYNLGVHHFSVGPVKETPVEKIN